MIHDAQNLFSDAQALTANAVSTNIIDLGAARNVGVGNPIYVVLCVDVAFSDSGNNSTVTVDLQGDSTTSFTPDGTQTLFSIATNAAAGTVYIARIAPDAAGQFQYIRLNYTMVNGDVSTGTVTAFLAHDVQKYQSYADAITIS